ncbi:hypothetical protein STEG23_029192 [Scotinomys teguina]
MDRFLLKNPDGRGNWRQKRSRNCERLGEHRIQASQLTLDHQGELSAMSEGPEERSPWGHSTTRQIRGETFGADARLLFCPIDCVLCLMEALQFHEVQFIIVDLTAGIIGVLLGIVSGAYAFKAIPYFLCYQVQCI